MKDSNCPHDPRLMLGAIGMYHCPECGEMQIAGLEHMPLLDDEEYNDLVKINKI